MTTPKTKIKVKNQGLMGMAANSGNRRAVGAKKVGVVGPVSGNPKLESWMNLAFEEQFTDRTMLWKPVNTKGWRPHSMGEPCDRISVLEMLGYRGSPIDLGLRRIFDMGHAVETQWRTYFSQMGLLINANVRVHRQADPVINGEYDVLIRHMSEEGRRFIGDIKSINTYGFSRLPVVTMDAQRNQEALMSLTGPLYSRVRKYVMQLQMYMRLAGVSEGFLLFSNKNDSDFADYYLVQDDEMVEAEFDRLRVRDGYRGRLAVPPCSCEKPPRKRPEKPFELCWHKTEEEVSLDDFKKLTTAEGLI